MLNDLHWYIKNAQNSTSDHPRKKIFSKVIFGMISNNNVINMIIHVPFKNHGSPEVIIIIIIIIIIFANIKGSVPVLNSLMEYLLLLIA